jgi:hypothetical protein
MSRNNYVNMFPKEAADFFNTISKEIIDKRRQDKDIVMTIWFLFFLFNPNTPTHTFIWLYIYIYMCINVYEETRRSHTNTARSQR